MDKKMLTYVGIGILIGVIAAPKLRSLPVVSKLPVL